VWKVLIAILFIMQFPESNQADKYSGQREKMVERQIAARGVTDYSTLRAMKKVPRHFFVPEEFRDEAYGDFPLPIGRGQTISQPYIVAYMTEAAKPSSKSRVLEIGTGSGYQAAVLAEIVDSVFTIEIVEELAEESSQRLRQLGYSNIVVRAADGYNGWKEKAPFDIIIVTAAAAEIPQPLIDQLADNGKLVIPVGSQGEVQELILLTRKKEKIEKKNLTFVRFVPFTRSAR
jgi:protein-L-isoaspartate(D-aspartate) O-methyltransferase